MMRPDVLAVRTQADPRTGRADWAPGVILRWDSTRGLYRGPGAIVATAGQVRRWRGIYFVEASP